MMMIPVDIERQQHGHGRAVNPCDPRAPLRTVGNNDNDHSEALRVGRVSRVLPGK